MTTATSIDPAVDFDGLLPEGETLKDYQHVGVAYALVNRRCFIADEQGLGKTRQALVAIEAADAYPALIVCKASLKGHWEAETRRCLPHRSVQTLGGLRPFETFADVVIVNYDILAAWKDGLVANGYQSLILDESHYCKDPGTDKKPVQRTRAILEIGLSIPDTGLMLNLTGTSVLNNPAELVTQLRLIRRLEEVTPRPRAEDPDDRDWEYAFKFSYCGPKRNENGYWEFKGSSNTERLNDLLRGCCYIRRERKDVLGMSETERITVPLSLNGALAEYREAESRMREYVEAHGGIEAVIKHDRAEALNTITVLRHLAGMAKVEAAAEWINDWLEENPERKLVVFAWHEDVQRAIAAKTGGIYLKGAKSLDAAKAEFNEGEARVIVCSLQAHREGHTLVAGGAAQDVLFVEQPWHPGAVSQAEDRINRIGRTAEGVFSWTLLASDTIDEWLNGIIQKKWRMFKAVVQGRDVETSEEDDSAVQTQLLRAIFGQEEAA